MEEGIKVNEWKKGWRWWQYLHCMRFKWQQSRGLWWHLVRLWLSVQWTYDQGPLPTVSSNTMWAAPPSVTQCYMPAQPDQFAIQYSSWQMYPLPPINSCFSGFPFFTWRLDETHELQYFLVKTRPFPRSKCSNSWYCYYQGNYQTRSSKDECTTDFSFIHSS